VLKLASSQPASRWSTLRRTEYLSAKVFLTIPFSLRASPEMKTRVFSVPPLDESDVSWLIGFSPKRMSS
jgi:hypothetical protein